MVEATHKLRVAIVGGGITGLTLAVFLTRLGKVDLQIFEAAAVFSEIGAGISLGPNALSVYKEEGLYDEYIKLAAGNQKSNTFFEFRFGDRGAASDVVYTLTTEVGQGTAHRAELLDLLVARLPKESVHFRKSLSHYEQTATGSVILYFADGSVAETDVLIGSDGIKSSVRHIMHDKRGEGAGQDLNVSDPQWSGTIAYRGLIPMDQLKSAIGADMATAPTCWMGFNKHLVVFPIQQGRTVNVVVFVSDRTGGRNPKWHNGPWVERDVPQSEMLQAFEGWAEPVQKLLQLIKSPSKWAVFELGQLSHFVEGKVAVMGDAAHGMLPHQGNGASQGIEDAYILARLLSHGSVNAVNVGKALTAYEVSRKVRAQAVQEMSYQTGLVYELVSSCGDDPKKIADVLEARHKWIWEVDVKAELRDALQFFETP